MRARASLALLTGVLLVPLLSPAAAAEDTVLKAAISSSSIPARLGQDFGQVLQGQSVVLEITVTNERSTPLAIGSVKPMCACMSEKSDRKVEAGKTGTISLRLETADYSGPVTEAALVEWVDAAVPVTRVELKLDVKPVLQILPKKLVRFRAVHGRAADQVVELKTTDGSPFVIQGFETSAPFLKAGAVVTGSGSSHRLTITLGADAPVGMLSESVTVRTNLPTLPSVKLNVTGVVSAESQAPATR